MTETDSSESIPKPRFKKDEVMEELGRGGFGVVVRVRNLHPSENEPRMAAMKAETVDPEGKSGQTIKVEAHVLTHLEDKKHFCKLYLACRLNEHTNIMIMSLVGRSLSWLRRNCPDQHFTISTAVRISLQCLNAIEALHSRGFLHRDIKASNFAIGRDPSNCRTIHLLDFGFARSFLKEEDGELKMRPPRKKAPFLGTERYCSINVHNRGEHGRADDLWSFFFMVVEFIKGQLPWRNTEGKKLVAAKQFYIDTMLEKCPQQLWCILIHLRGLTYDSRPDYELIRQSLDDVSTRYGFLESDPYDWEVGGRYYRSISKLKKRS